MLNILNTFLFVQVELLIMFHSVLIIHKLQALICIQQYPEKP